ncbi:hypothetical protein O3P69_018877 [Scylla paramamosain]|uniref:Uncharacterized protein n=1 Tax=Scylla paramamosain TaxID=85552 RepID=A0AAW0SS24_SCYPA
MQILASKGRAKCDGAGGGGGGGGGGSGGGGGGAAVLSAVLQVRSVRQSEGDKGDAKVQRHTCAGIPNWPLIQVCLVPPATAESTPVTRRQDCTLKGSFENLFSNASIFFFFRQIF